MEIGWEIAKITFYLVVVIGLIYLLNYFFKKNISKTGRGKYVKIIERVYLSPKKSLVLLTVHDTVLLISDSEDRVGVLHTWNKQDFPQIKGELTNEQSFKEYWQQILKNNRRGKDD